MQEAFLDRRRRGYQEVVRHLRGAGEIGELLGAGVFSAVFAAEGGAFKITTDFTSIKALKRAREAFPDDRHLLRFTFAGRLGGIEHPTGTQPLYGVRLERLAPIAGFPALRPIAREITAQLKPCIDHESQMDGLKACARSETIPASVRQTLYRLCKVMLHRKHLRVDLHKENMMVRPGTGELVFNDPFVDVNYYD